MSSRNKSTAKNKKPKVTTSSHACTKPNVVHSPNVKPSKNIHDKLIQDSPPTKIIKPVSGKFANEDFNDKQSQIKNIVNKMSLPNAKSILLSVLDTLEFDSIVSF